MTYRHIPMTPQSPRRNRRVARTLGKTLVFLAFVVAGTAFLGGLGALLGIVAGCAALGLYGPPVAPGPNRLERQYWAARTYRRPEDTHDPLHPYDNL